jgi:division protein CdvB (Snf7/Vps24/ESCRT-III family)
VCPPAIQQAEAKSKAEIKLLSKKGDQASARVLARELVRSRRAVDRIHTSKAQLNSVSMQLTNQLGAASPLFPCPAHWLTPCGPSNTTA